MRFCFLLIPVVLFSCSNDRSTVTTTPALFTDVAIESGITFRNDLTFTEQLNPYTYRNFYNGAGVGIGDINNDGLLDIYLSGNQVDNKLYLNQGNLQFKDITEEAGVACTGSWSTGLTFVDINSDGLLDIYVCKSGSPDTPRRNNELFVNNGDLTFSERSKEYGLDITGLSVQASFFDFDKDGDLDCYLLTNSIKSVGKYDLVQDSRSTPDPLGGGNKFFINENGKFIDYSAKAGIYRSTIGFGLGITLGDFNNDTWTDIFVSNDFFERDYLYINDQRGAFRESLTDYFQSISMGSMGADFADLDDDGNPELFVTEMLPDSLNRKKTKTIFESWNKYELNVKSGYHYQFARNVLQKKIGEGSYAEIGRLSGISATEWSWGALLFDMNNDGRRDIFVANGIYKDLLDRDYLTYTSQPDNVKKIIREEKQAIIKLINLMPASTFPNYTYRNDGDLHFTNTTVQWGLGQPNYSSGSAYGDLDNDGDLDLVVSNINALIELNRNNSDSSKFKSLTILLSSKTKNTYEVGSGITAYCGDRVYFADNFVTRGFQSSVQPNITIGLGEIKKVDSVLIRWSSGGYSIFYDVQSNKRLAVVKEQTKVFDVNPWKSAKPEKRFSMELVSKSVFRHRGSGLVDFNRDRLLPMMYSNETPSLSKADIDKDGIDELYVGGGKDQEGALLHFKDGKITATSPVAIAKYAISEETKGTFFDADGDGNLDFYMSNGGRFFPKESSANVDHLFINNGNGEFSESIYPLPFAEFVSTSVAKAIDFDNDGDFDLVIGERFEPFVYGTGGGGYLFENDGKGKFTDVTMQYAPDLHKIGMITDIEIQDIDNDGWKDMIIVGDWMPVVVLKNNKRNFANESQQLGLAGTEGWWHAIKAADVNSDGKPDFIIGNHGLNTFFKPHDRMYVGDFDGNGFVEQIYATQIDGKYYPIVDKDEFLSQLPSYKKKLLYYKDYGKKSIDDLFDDEVLKKAKVFEVKILASVLLLSDGNGYNRIELPKEAQFSSVYALSVYDFDRDGIQDIIAGGNQFQVKPQFGRYDASNGWFFKGELHDGKFSLRRGVSLNVKGEIRDIQYVDSGGIIYVLFAKYDDDLEIYKLLR